MNIGPPPGMMGQMQGPPHMQGPPQMQGPPLQGPPMQGPPQMQGQGSMQGPPQMQVQQEKFDNISKVKSLTGQLRESLAVNFKNNTCLILYFHLVGNNNKKSFGVTRSCI